MAVAFRSLASTAYAGRTNITVTAPAGIQDGDILVFVVATAANPEAPDPTFPAGFNLVSVGPSDVTNASFNFEMRVAWKLAASEAGSYTATHAAASSVGAVIAYSGAELSPITVTPTLNTGLGSTTTATGLTTSFNDSMVIFIAHDWGEGGAITPPAGTTPTFTERLDITTSVLLYIADGVLATAGATGNKTIVTNNTAGEPWAVYLVCLDPLGSAPPAGHPIWLVTA